MDWSILSVLKEREADICVLMQQEVHNITYKVFFIFIMALNLITSLQGRGWMKMLNLIKS